MNMTWFGEVSYILTLQGELILHLLTLPYLRFLLSTQTWDFHIWNSLLQSKEICSCGCSSFNPCSAEGSWEPALLYGRHQGRCTLYREESWLQPWEAAILFWEHLYYLVLELSRWHKGCWGNRHLGCDSVQSLWHLSREQIQWKSSKVNGKEPTTSNTSPSLQHFLGTSLQGTWSSPWER